MKEVPEADRPFEKCQQFGPSGLSTEELLAVVLRSGTKNSRVTQVARKLLDACEVYGGLAYLSRMPLKELLDIDGIGRVKALQLLCICELSRRMAVDTKRNRDNRIESPADAAEYFMKSLGRLEEEETWVLLLDGRNNCIHRLQLTKGTANSSIMPVRELLSKALRFGCVAVMLVHNHPSGDVLPSLEDIAVTKRLKSAAELLELELVDHIVVGEGDYYSFRENGLL